MAPQYDARPACAVPPAAAAAPPAARPLLGGACGLLDAAPPSAPPAAPARAPSVGAYFGATQTAAPTAAAAAATADPYAYGQRAYDAAPTGAAAGHHRFSAAMATPNAAFISADGTTFSARRYGMALCERPLHPNTGVHVLEITIGSVDASDLVGGGFVGVAAPAVARCKFPPGLVRGSVAYTFDVQTLRQEEVKGTHVTSATKLPPGRGAVVGQLSTPGERGLESQTREQLHMVATDLPPFRVGDRLRMELDTATGRLAWLLNGKLITTINGVPGGYHFAVGSHMSPTFEATIDVQVPSVKQASAAPAGASASTAQQFFDGRSQAAAVQAQATSGVGKDGETAPYAQAPHVSLQQQLNPPQPPGYPQQPAYSSPAWQKPPAVPPLGQQGYPHAQAQVHGYPQQQPAPAAAQHPYNATRDGVPVAKAVAVVQPPMAEVAWYPYFDSRREATVKLLGQTENSAGARHFAGGVIEIRLGAISLSPHARASLPPRLSVQVVLFGKPVKRRELPAAELQAALQGTATGGEAYIPLDSLFAPFTYEIAADELPKLLGASPLCEIHLVNQSAQAPERGAALDAPAQPPLLIARAWVDLAAMSSDLVDERRPLLRADVTNPSTHDAVGTIVFSIVATGERPPLPASPSRSSKSPKSVRERSASPPLDRTRERVAVSSRPTSARGVRPASAGSSRPGTAGSRPQSARSKMSGSFGGSTAGAALMGSTSGSCAPTIVTSGYDRAKSPGRPQSGARGMGESFVAKEANLVYPGRADQTFQDDQTYGAAAMSTAEELELQKQGLSVPLLTTRQFAEHADLAKLRPRRAVQELHATHRVTGNHIKDRPLWMEWRERQLAPETPKVGEMVVVLEVRNHYKYTKIAKKEDGSADGGAAADLFASLDNSATSGGEGANATAAGALDLTTTERDEGRRSGDPPPAERRGRAPRQRRLLPGLPRAGAARDARDELLRFAAE